MSMTMTVLLYIFAPLYTPLNSGLRLINTHDLNYKCYICSLYHLLIDATLCLGTAKQAHWVTLFIVST